MENKLVIAAEASSNVFQKQTLAEFEKSLNSSDAKNFRLCLSFSLHLKPDFR